MTWGMAFTTGPIRALDFQRFAVAVGDLNPIYFDRAAAQAAGYADVVAPPNYVTAVLSWEPGPVEAQMQLDGTAGRFPPELQGKRAMGGGQELVLAGPVYDGDTLSATTRLIESTRKRSSKGEALHIAVMQTDYRNQRGELVISCKVTVLFAD